MKDAPNTIKAALRKEMKARRAALTAAHPDAGERLAEAFEARGDWPDAEVVAGFHPFGSEIDPLALLMRFHARKYSLALPCLVPPMISGEVDASEAMQTVRLSTSVITPPPPEGVRHRPPGSPDIGGGSMKMIFRAYDPVVALVEGPYRILQPEEAAPEVWPDLLLVPLLAFDREGGRLGYGGGFYDRALDYLKAAKRVKDSPLQVWGVAFSAQEVARVPTEPHDQRLDAVLTEQGVIEIRKNT